ncbi:MAG: hypothetical protein BMS9Abin13_042 [Patescibacteria group bacterium]|nr:MAG: hypothetical protein BMS9Abin13_042 [Patescibacteria group bacterium]
MYIKVRVVSSSKKERIMKTSDDEFAVYVREPAERNLANKRVVRMIADHFKVPARGVRIVTGHRSPGKILVVEKD